MSCTNVTISKKRKSIHIDDYPLGNRERYDTTIDYRCAGKRRRLTHVYYEGNKKIKNTLTYARMLRKYNSDITKYNITRNNPTLHTEQRIKIYRFYSAWAQFHRKLHFESKHNRYLRECNTLQSI
jgi:hypothetical protein